MGDRYGKWPGVVAIVDEGEMWCVPCARLRYGEQPVQAAIDGVPGDERYTDVEWKLLDVLLHGSSDLHAEWCVRCGVVLCDEACLCRQPGQAEHYREYGRFLDESQEREEEERDVEEGEAEEMEYEDVREACVVCSRRTDGVCFGCGSPLCWQCDDRFGCPMCL